MGRAFEPAEMKNCRSGPSHLKPCLEPVGAVRRNGVPSVAPSRAGSGNRGDTDVASAKTVRSGESGKRSSGWKDFGPKPKPAWALTHQNPMPNKPFVAMTDNQEREANALQERARHFPYRDEFAPRSKRLLYEMALQRCSRDSVKSASSIADDMSCFTLPSTAAGSAASGRSSSTPSLGRPPTGDSQRLTVSIAKRRKELETRAPQQNIRDMNWLRQIQEEEGPVGVATANFPGHFHEDTLQRMGERIICVNKILDGKQDHVMRSG